MSRRSPYTDLDRQLRTIGGSLRSEIVGAVVLVLGIFLFVSALRYNPSSASAPPFVVVMMGWTAPFFALALIILGLVLLLRQRAGYWSAEAIVGAELLLLGLQTGAFVANNASPDWNVRLDGSDGGMVGWAIGNLLLAAIGQVLATVIVALCVCIGLYMLVRYTPLIYVAAAIGRWIPILPSIGRRISRSLRLDRGGRESYPPLPYSENFVAPTHVEPVVRTQPAPAFVSPEASSTKQRSGQRTGATAIAAAATSQTPSTDQPSHLPPPKTASATPPAGAKQPGAAKPVRSVSPLPPHDLLDADPGAYGNLNAAHLERTLLNALQDFNVPARIVHVETGPTVTQFGVEPLYVERAGQKRKVRVNRIVSLENDLSLALAARVRIEAPVPGRPYVGIEVPNPEKSLVSLRGIIDSAEMRKGGILTLPLGRNTAGHPVVMDLTRAPHLLIAGATGSGKSVCINTVVTGLLMQHGPETLRYILVDPKMVELPGYNGIPHLYGKVITDIAQVMGALTWLLLQMDDRYQLFRDLGVRNIELYNAAIRKNRGGQVIPYIVLVIDELADLMMTAADDVERQICRLAQMARATGIHLVLATQRPSTDVITGLIKANFPTRISFSVTSQIDSRVILDTPGAQTLLGRGDMLLMRPESGKLTRIQGCYVSDEEIGRVVQHWKAQKGETPNAPPPWNSIMDRLDDEDELIQDAIVVLRGMRTCSASMLQRRMGLGYPKAARLMEELERRGFVGPDLGAGRGRAVLLKPEQGTDSGSEDAGNDFLN